MLHPGRSLHVPPPSFLVRCPGQQSPAAVRGMARKAVSNVAVDSSPATFVTPELFEPTFMAADQVTAPA